MSILSQILGQLTQPGIQAQPGAAAQGPTAYTGVQPVLGEGGEALPVMSPSQPLVVAPQVEETRSPLGQLGHIIGQAVSPDPGSYWWAALHGGLANARATQANYPIERRAAEAAAARAEAQARSADATASAAERDNRLGLTRAGARVLRTDDAGNVTAAYEPPPTPSANENLLQRWLAAGEGSPYRALIERILPGFQYTPEVIAAQAAGRTDTAVAAAHARGDETLRAVGARNAGAMGRAVYSATHRAGRSSSGGARPPAGFILRPRS